MITTALKEIIFVVEDNEMRLFIMKTILAKHGFEVIVVQRAEQALALLEEVVPDLIVVFELGLDMKAAQFCQEIRNRPETRVIPILLATYRSEAEYIQAALDAGASETMHPMIVPRQFVNRVRKLLESGANHPPHEAG